MKKFLKRICSFGVVFAVLMIGLQLIIVHVRNSSLRLPKEINKVFLGNSTIEYGVNDKYIPGGVNFAQNGEPVDLMYAKIRLLQKFNPQVDTIFVELDDITLFNTNLVPVLSNAIYFDAFTPADWWYNLKGFGFERFMKYFSHAYDFIKLRPIIENIGGKHHISDLGVGGYADLYRDKIEEDLGRRGKQKIKESIPEIPATSMHLRE